MMKDPIIKAYGRKFKKEYKAFYKAIREFKRIFVFRHIKPDFDALGSQFGLVTFLKDNFPDKEIHFVGDDHVTFCPRIFPYTERLGEEAFESDFLAIILDVNDHSRIADPRYQKAKRIIKFDHHPCKEPVGHINILDTEAAAAAEILTDALLSFPGTYISPEAAKYLYIGIVGDSGRFQYSSTSAHTFACASALIARDISLPSIYQSMYQKTTEDLKIQAYVLTHYSISEHGVAYYLLPEKVQKDFGLTSERGKENVNMFSNIEGINVWCSITEDNDPKDYCWRVSIRSKAKDISGVAQKWGGGGHAQASGARIDDIKDLEKFVKDLDDLFA